MTFCRFLRHCQKQERRPPAPTVQTEFTTCNNVFTCVIKTLRKRGLNTTVHRATISEDDFKAIKKVLDTSTPEGQVNKVWFDIQLHTEVKRVIGN